MPPHFETTLPFPEPSIYRPSNLTKKQRQEQLAAVYGVPMADQFSPSEIARMRQIIAAQDDDRKPIQTLDLNNPPRQPYRYEKFPKMVYDHANSYPVHEKEVQSRSGYIETVIVPARVISRIVFSEDELAGAMADGWNEEAPTFSEQPETAPTGKYQNEADTVQERIEETKRKSGRPTNAERALRAGA